MSSLNSVAYQLVDRKGPPDLQEIFPDDWLAQLIQVTVESLETKPSFDLSARIDEHLGEELNYGMKDQILEGLKSIYSVMVDGNTSQDNKAVIALKLVERAENCTPGFHDGVNAIVEGFERPDSIDALLYRIRHDIVSKTANQTTDEVHSNNRFFTFAETAGYGVRALNPKDGYHGAIPDEIIQAKLETAFSRDYRPINIVIGMEDQIRSELLQLGYTGSGPQDPDTMSKCLEFLTVLFKDLPAVIKQRDVERDVLNRQESYHQEVKVFMVANRAKVQEFIPSLTNESLINALIENRFPAPFKSKYLDKLDEDTKIGIAQIQQDYHQFNEKIKPLATQMNEDKALIINPFQLIVNDQLELNWNLIKQRIREELRIKQYLTETESEKMALNALFDEDLPFDGMSCDSLELNGLCVVALLNMKTLSDEKINGILDWYICSKQDTPEDKFASLIKIREIGQHNTSIRSVLDKYDSVIDGFMNSVREDWLSKLDKVWFESDGGTSYPACLLQDKKFMLEAMNHNRDAFRYASAALKGDKDFMLEALQHDREAFKSASYELWGDKDFMFEALQHDREAFRYASEELRGNKDFMFEALRHDREAFRYTSEELRGDKDFMLEAMKYHPQAVRYASTALREDKNFMFNGLKHDIENFKAASAALKGDKDFMLEAMRLNREAFKDASAALMGDKDFMLEAMKHDRTAYQYASAALWGDKDFMLEAMKHDRTAFKYASVALWGDKDFILKATNQDIGFASEAALREDKDFIFKAMQQNYRAIQFASEALRGDKDFMLKAIKHDYKAFNFVSEALRGDRAFMLEAKKLTWSSKLRHTS